MILRNARPRWAIAAIAALFCVAGPAPAAEKSPAGGVKAEPPRVVAPPAGSETPPRSATNRKELLAHKPGEHPLAPAIRWARQGIRDVEKIKDYSMVMVKRDRSSGKVSEFQYAFCKVRHEPLSFYMHFLGPKDLKGQEVIWVKGKNKGLMWAHGTGTLRTLFGTVSLRPNGPVAMRGQRYPLTEMGILNMLRRLVEVGEKDMQYGECEVRYFEGAKINDRRCICIQVVHPVPRRNFLFYVARIFVDDELNLPVRFEFYDWPAKPGGPPLLSEEFTFLDMKVNVGLTDADFDIRNANYDFP